MSGKTIKLEHLMNACNALVKASVALREYGRNVIADQCIEARIDIQSAIGQVEFAVVEDAEETK